MDWVKELENNGVTNMVEANTYIETSNSNIAIARGVTEDLICLRIEFNGRSKQDVQEILKIVSDWL